MATKHSYLVLIVTLLLVASSVLDALITGQHRSNMAVRPVVRQEKKEKQMGGNDKCWEQTRAFKTILDTLLNENVPRWLKSKGDYLIETQSDQFVDQTVDLENTLNDINAFCSVPKEDLLAAFSELRDLAYVPQLETSFLKEKAMELLSAWNIFEKALMNSPAMQVIIQKSRAEISERSPVDHVKGHVVNAPLRTSNYKLNTHVEPKIVPAMIEPLQKKLLKRNNKAQQYANTRARRGLVNWITRELSEWQDDSLEDVFSSLSEESQEDTSQESDDELLESEEEKFESPYSIDPATGLERLSNFVAFTRNAPWVMCDWPIANKL